MRLRRPNSPARLYNARLVLWLGHSIVHRGGTGIARTRRHFLKKWRGARCRWIRSGSGWFVTWQMTKIISRGERVVYQQVLYEVQYQFHTRAESWKNERQMPPKLIWLFFLSRKCDRVHFQFATGSSTTYYKLLISLRYLKNQRILL